MFKNIFFILETGIMVMNELLLNMIIHVMEKRITRKYSKGKSFQIITNKNIKQAYKQDQSWKEK